MAKYFAVIPCAGSGSRFKAALPKQYYPLLGKTVLDFTLAAFLKLDKIAQIYVICQKDDKHIANYYARYAASKVTFLPLGGLTRAETVKNALAYLHLYAGDWVLVHDAARCCIAPEDIERLITEVSRDNTSGGILAARATDTLKQVDAAGMVVTTIDRNYIYQAQTPQMFKADELLAALKLCENRQFQVTDEASAMEYSSKTVKIVESGNPNLKITQLADIKVAEANLSAITSGAPKNHV